MRVLLADDSGIARLHVGSVLREAGHDVTAVENGREAWEAFEREPYPMAILDWMMPELDGIDVLRRIRASDEGAHCFVLIVTGRGTTRDIMDALNAGADDFVSKPVSSEYLRARLLIAERSIQLSASARRMEAELRRAEWLAGIGQTVLTLQHEINNPLAVLLLETKTLVHETRLPPDLAERLGTLLQQVERIAAVVQELSALEDPHIVEPIKGIRMLGLSQPISPREHER